MSKGSPLLGPMRLPFLILTPACVVLGLGAAVWTTGEVNPGYFFLVLIGAVCAHISANAFNEWFDFKSGLDARTTRTPFSGGSGALQAHPELERAALGISAGSLALTALVGLFFVFVRGLGLLPLGILGLLTIFVYTPWATRVPFPCLIAPGLGFGTLMVMGTHYALTGQYSWPAFAASLVPFFLVNDLLLLNQFPDVEADRSIGRRHYPIVLGRRRAGYIYNGMLIATYMSIIVSVLLGVLPPASLLGLLTLVAAVPVIGAVWRHPDDLKALAPSLGLNVLINILTPVLMAIGLLVA